MKHIMLACLLLGFIFNGNSQSRGSFRKPGYNNTKGSKVSPQKTGLIPVKPQADTKVNPAGERLSSVKLTSEEMKLYNLIMAYRKENNLPLIPLSKSLTYVAQVHCLDLATNHPDVGECNAHSWSDKGKWKAVCYTPDHKNAALMWSKPAELTDYKFNGFEIGFSTTGLADAPGALASWKGSPGHNAVMINGSIWKDMNWKAIGVGLYKGYSVVWFGDNTDAAGEPAKP